MQAWIRKNYNMQENKTVIHVFFQDGAAERRQERAWKVSQKQYMCAAIEPVTSFPGAE